MTSVPAVVQDFTWELTSEMETLSSLTVIGSLFSFLTTTIAVIVYARYRRFFIGGASGAPVLDLIVATFVLGIISSLNFFVSALLRLDEKLQPYCDMSAFGVQVFFIPQAILEGAFFVALALDVTGRAVRLSTVRYIVVASIVFGIIIGIVPALTLPENSSGTQFSAGMPWCWIPDYNLPDRGETTGLFVLRVFSAYLWPFISSVVGLFACIFYFVRLKNYPADVPRSIRIRVLYYLVLILAWVTYFIRYLVDGSHESSGVKEVKQIQAILLPAVAGINALVFLVSEKIAEKVQIPDEPKEEEKKTEEKPKEATGGDGKNEKLDDAKVGGAAVVRLDTEARRRLINREEEVEKRNTVRMRAMTAPTAQQQQGADYDERADSLLANDAVAQQQIADAEKDGKEEEAPVSKTVTIASGADGEASSSAAMRPTSSMSDADQAMLELAKLANAMHGGDDDDEDGDGGAVARRQFKSRRTTRIQHLADEQEWVIMEDDDTTGETKLQYIPASLINRVLTVPKARLPWAFGFMGGFCDTAGFLAMGLFTCHVTGNYVIMGSYIQAGDGAGVGLKGTLQNLFAYLVFILFCAFTRATDSISNHPRWCVAAETFFLFVSFVVAHVTAPGANSLREPEGDGKFTKILGAGALISGYSMVAAMAIQNVVQRMYLVGQPMTLFMTGNSTQTMMDFVDLIRKRNDKVALAAIKKRIHLTLPTILAFFAGCVCATLLYLHAHVKWLFFPAPFISGGVLLAFWGDLLPPKAKK